MPGPWSKQDSESSSSSTSESNTDESSVQVQYGHEKSIKHLLLQSRYAMSRRIVDYEKLLKSLTLLATKLERRHSSKSLSTVLKIATSRLCHQVRRCLESESFPVLRQDRRLLKSSGQAKACLALQQRGDQLVSVLEQACDISLPREMIAESSEVMLNDLERFMLDHPLRAIPLELLNTFEIICIRSISS